MQHVGIAEPEYAAVLAVSCPECQHPMVLVRVLPALGQQPPLGRVLLQALSVCFDRSVEGVNWEASMPLYSSATP
jgi:hypothetical protein